MKSKQYEHKTYETYKGYITEGFYTIAEVEAILSVMRATREHFKKNLAASMKESKDANTRSS